MRQRRWHKHMCAIQDDESDHKCNRVYKTAYSKSGGQGLAVRRSTAIRCLPKSNIIVSVLTFSHGNLAYGQSKGA